MNGKGNYDKKSNEITKDISKYTGVSKVFICYDIDNPCKPTYSINPNIETYAKYNNFKTIWFNEDIEMAYIKKSIHQSEKTLKAIQFVAHKDIDTIIELDLSQTIVSQKNSSNILTVLDSYLKRK